MCINFVKKENIVGDREIEVVSVSSEKRKEVIGESEEKEKSNQFIVCKSMQRSNPIENVLFFISYIEIPSLLI